jgi:hypothetical protein
VKELLIAALGPALVLFISELFRYLHTKSERKERFFYEMYPKRLVLYEEIIKTLAFVDDIENASTAESALEISAIYTQGVKRLLALDFRCRLFGSSRVITAVNALAETVHSQDEFIMTHQELFNSEAVAPEFLEAFTGTIAARKGAIVTLIQAEAGTDLIDKKISNVVPGLNAKKYKAKKGDNDITQRNEFKYHKPSC